MNGVIQSAIGQAGGVSALKKFEWFYSNRMVKAALGALEALGKWCFVDLRNTGAVPEACEPDAFSYDSIWDGTRFYY
jgi:hypothetical protein